jgi:hypothetical protein
MTCHLGCEENDGDEDKQINEKINKIRYERHIIMQRYFFEACIVFYETIDIFGDIEHDDDKNQQADRK